MRFRFSLSMEGDPMSGEETLTIDAAIALAKILRKRQSVAIYVREFDGGQSRTRGRADEPGWRWLRACPKCKGEGALTVQSKTTPVLTSIVSCTCCRGTKVVEDIDHG
jgi:hypothetical protein